MNMRLPLVIVVRVFLWCPSGKSLCEPGFLVVNSGGQPVRGTHQKTVILLHYCLKSIQTKTKIRWYLPATVAGKIQPAFGLVKQMKLPKNKHGSNDHLYIHIFSYLVGRELINRLTIRLMASSYSKVPLHHMLCSASVVVTTIIPVVSLWFCPLSSKSSRITGTETPVKSLIGFRAINHKYSE